MTQLVSYNITQMKKVRNYYYSGHTAQQWSTQWLSPQQTNIKIIL